MSLAASALPRPARRDPLAIFLFFSLLLHFLLLFFLPFPQHDLVAPPAEQLTEVELLPPPPPPPPPPSVVAKVEPPLAEKPKSQEEPKQKPPEPKPQEKLPEQIVSPPDQVNDQIPEKTRLLSDRNSTAKEEAVARGMPRPAPVPKEQPPVKEKTERQKPPVQLARKTPTPPHPKPPVEQQVEKAISEVTPLKRQTPGNPAAPQRTPQLFASPGDLLSQGWLSDAGSDREKKEERQSPQGRDLIALAPPPRQSLFSLPGPLGIPDYLPDIRQGNLTFLNTKAHRFAPFVRRVAMRVFQHLIILQRKQLHINDVVAARDVSTIEAKLDVQGNLKKLVIQTRSGSYAVDEALLQACQNGAWDENPPGEAQAEDGYIHFIFRSDIEAQFDDIGLRTILTTLEVGLV